MVSAYMEKQGLDREARWLSTLALIGGIWYLVNLAAFAFVVTASQSSLAARYTPAQLDYINSMPGWSLLMSGLAIAFGLVACTALIFRKMESYSAFMLSLLMAIGHFIDVIGRGGFLVMGPGDAASSILLMLFALFLFWAAFDAKTHGQLS